MKELTVTEVSHHLITFFLLVCYMPATVVFAEPFAIDDFEKPYYGLNKQGSTSVPKEVPLIVIGWEPQGKGEPTLDEAQLEDLFFGQENSVADWFRENSQGRYRIVPHPDQVVAGPYQSRYEWPFYWRNDPNYVRRLLCGSPTSFCTAWEENPFKVPPDPSDPHYFVTDSGEVRYLDDEGFIGGHTHSWAEAIRQADAVIDFSICDKDSDGRMSSDECIIVIVKAQTAAWGTRRPVVGRHIPIEDLKVDNVVIDTVSELYVAPPHDNSDLAVAIEEVLHLAANLADQYPDDTTNRYRLSNDSRRPGQLALTDAGQRPVHIDPFHKLKWGWLNPQLVDHSGTYTLRSAATTGDALILFRPYIGTNEFFLVENRWRGTSYDRFRSNDRQEGLAIWHCIQDSSLSNDFGRRAVHLRRVDPRLDAKGRIQWHLTLFDGSDSSRNADLSDTSQPQNLQFQQGMSSFIQIDNISPAGPEMTLRVFVQPGNGEIATAVGHVTMVRTHAKGTGYGPVTNALSEDGIVSLDSLPGVAFGIELETIVGRNIFSSLQHAFDEGSTVQLEYRSDGAIGGSVIRVIEVR